MTALIFVLLLVAAVLFGVEAWLHRSLVAAGLCLLTAAFLVPHLNAVF